MPPAEEIPSSGNWFCKQMEGFKEPIGNSENDQREIAAKILEFLKKLIEFGAKNSLDEFQAKLLVMIQKWVEDLEELLRNENQKWMEDFGKPIRKYEEEFRAKLVVKGQKWKEDFDELTRNEDQKWMEDFEKPIRNSKNDLLDSKNDLPIRLFLDETRVKAILPSTPLGGGQITSSTELFRDLPRRIRRLIDGTSRKRNLQVLPVYLPKKSKYQAPTFPIAVVESVPHSLPAAITTSVNNNPPVISTPTSRGQVGDDIDRGSIPSVPDNEQPRSNSALANQIDLEAGRTSGNQPLPHDHGHAGGAGHQPPAGDHDSVEDGCANKIEIGVMITGQLLSILDAIRAHKTSEMSHYTKGLWYTLVGSSLIGSASYWNAFFIYRFKRSSLVSKLVRGTAYTATCSALLAIIALELPDKFNVGFYLAACAFCLPSAIFRAIK